MANFILPGDFEEFEEDGTTPVPGGAERREKVKQWALSRMAESFRTYKKSCTRIISPKGKLLLSRNPKSD